MKHNCATDWIECSIGQIGEIVSGTTPSTSVPAFWDGEIPFITPADLSSLKGAYISETERCVTTKGLRGRMSEPIPALNPVISSRAPVGYVALPTMPYVTNQGCKAIVLGENQDSTFHYYSLCFNRDSIQRASEGTTFQEISKSKLAKICVRIPACKTVQVWIGQVFATVDQQIAELEALIAKQERVRAGLLQALLTRGIDENGQARCEITGYQTEPWKMVPLRSICETITKGTTPSTVGAGYRQAGVPFLRVEAIGERGEILPEKLLYIDQATHETLRRSQILPGDLVFSIAGAIGRTAVVKDYSQMNCNQAVALVRPKFKRVNIEFLQLWLSSDKVQRAINDEVVQLAQANFSLSMLGQAMIPDIDVQEQNRIVNTISIQDASVGQSRKLLTKLRYLKIGLMHDLLTGRVSVEPLLKAEANP